MLINYFATKALRRQENEFEIFESWWQMIFSNLSKYLKKLITCCLKGFSK